MPGRSASALLLLPLLSLAAACDDEVGCPAGASNVDGVCVEDPDASMEVPDSGPDSTVPAICYLDYDHDGVGAGDPVDCSYVPDAGAADASMPSADPDAGPDLDDGAAADAGDAAAATDAGADVPADPPPPPPAVVMQTGDCDDHDPARAPTFDELCDGIDNDCDDEVDEDIRNACGGECLRPLDHQPGDTCSNGLLGTCARDGTYTCQGDNAVTCSATPIAPSTELCDDAIDNDCDGLVDEPDAANAPFWYQDCDADGYAASTTGAIQACTKPANAGSCTWTTTIPQPSTKTNWDCNDANPAYSPDAEYGFPPIGSTSRDLNCDGQNLAQPAPVPDFTVCSGSVVFSLNQGQAGQEDCSVNSTAEDNCIVWKRANGTYASAPESFCPDSGAESVNIGLQQSGPDDPGTYVCHTFAPPRSPIWPCR